MEPRTVKPQKKVLKMEIWQMETWTKTSGFFFNFDPYAPCLSHSLHLSPFPLFTRRCNGLRGTNEGGIGDRWRRVSVPGGPVRSFLFFFLSLSLSLSLFNGMKRFEKVRRGWITFERRFGEILQC